MKWLEKASKARRAVIACAVIGAAIPATVSLQASASVAHHVASGKNSPVKRGLRFYRGKTISFVSDGGPGGLFDIYARDIAPYLGTYLHATVNIVDVPGGASITGQNQAESANPDGLTIGELNSLADASNVLQHKPGINFNPGRVAYISSFGPGTLVLVASPSSPVKSIAQLKQSTTPVKVLTTQSGTGPALTRAIMGAMHFPVQWISGYQNDTAMITGFLRGDGPLTWLPLSLAGPLLSNGKAVALADTVFPPKGTMYRNLLQGIATTKDLMKKYPPRTHADKKSYVAVGLINQMAAVFPLFTGTSVAGYKIEALRTAMQWAYHQQSLQKTLLFQGQNDQYQNPVQAKQIYINALSDSKVLISYMAGF